MRKTLKQIMLSLIVVILLVSSVACAVTGNGNETVVGSTDQVNRPADDTYELIRDELPKDLDFQNETVSILWWSDVDGVFENEGDGEVVSEALYNRDITVEDRLGVDLEHIGMVYTWDTQSIYLNAIRSSVMAEDPIYDIVSGQYAIMPSLIVENAYLNLLEQKYLDFDKPWWLNGIVEETSIDGKMYLATGSIVVTSIYQIWCIYANQKLLNNYQLEDPVELVLSGDWTFDKLIEMTAGMYSDLDGDGAKSMGDTFGLVFPDSNANQGLEAAFEIHVTKNNSLGIPELAFGEARVNDIMTKIQETFAKDEFWQGLDGSNSYSIFAEGRTLFCAATFGDSGSRFRDMEDPFTVLPYPKYSDTQKGYYTKLGEVNNLFGIAINCDCVDAAAATMECLASEGYRQVDPAYFETALQIKYNPTSQSGQIYDLIRTGVTYDFGSLYGVSLGLPCQIKNYLCGNARVNWQTWWGKRAPSTQTALNAFIDLVQNLDE